MIKKNVIVGKHTIPVVAELGTGDIMITNHHYLDEAATLVSFTDCDEHEIGVTQVYNNGETSDNLESIPMALKFTNPKSIDSVIRQLELSKSMLIKLMDNNE